MGFIDKIRGLSRGGSRVGFFTFSGDCDTPSFTLDLTNNSGYKDAYDRCSTVKTVINRNAMAMANGKWWIVDEVDNDVLGNYPGVKKRIDSPNPLQTFTELLMQMDVYRQVYGRVYLYAPTPVGFNVQDAIAYWVINPCYIDIELSHKLYNQYRSEDIINKIWLNVGGQRTELPRENVLIINDINQNLSFGPLEIQGKSRLISLEFAIKNLIQAEEAIYSLNRDRGAMGLISSDSTDAGGTMLLTPKEKKEIQESYKSMYGLNRFQAKVIITDSKVKWQPISMSVKDLMIFEGMEENIQAICDVYDYPYELLGSIKGATYTNKLEAKKYHYDDAIIPYSKVYAECFSKFLKLNEGNKITVDFSEVGALKTAAAEAAKTFYQNANAVLSLYKEGVISREEARLNLDYDEKIYGNTTYDGKQKTESEGNQKDKGQKT